MELKEELSFGHDDRKRIYEYVERRGSADPETVREDHYRIDGRYVDEVMVAVALPRP